jgi:hypothetical protein
LPDTKARFWPKPEAKSDYECDRYGVRTGLQIASPGRQLRADSVENSAVAVLMAR